jgi:uncharacterized protein (TIGR00730 family)
MGKNKQTNQLTTAPSPTEKKPLTREELGVEAEKRASYIFKEFNQAFRFISRFSKTVSFFGSAKLDENNYYYQKARILAGKLARLGYTIVTGGGPGIMEGANRGAFEQGGISVGLNIKLAETQKPNNFTTDKMEFHYFFTRKVALSFAAEAYLFFPGGFGTLDEFFEMATLIQTKKIRQVPIVLIGHDYWMPLYDFVKNSLLTKHQTITETDLELIRLEDDDEVIIAIINEEHAKHQKGR